MLIPLAYQVVSFLAVLPWKTYLASQYDAQESLLLGVFFGTGLADYVYFDSTWIFQCSLDLGSHVAC